MTTSDMALQAPLSSLLQGQTDVSHEIAPLLHRIFVASHVLRLSMEVRFTAMVLVHRYHTAISGSQEESSRVDRKWVAAACLFLACKAEESHRRLRDVINLAQMIFSQMDDRILNEEEGNAGRMDVIQLQANPPGLDQGYWDSKKCVVETEQWVLRWIGFDVAVSHPHRAVALIASSVSSFLDSTTNQLLRSIGFRWLNDASFYGPALRHSTLEMAVAAIELAKFEISSTWDEEHPHAFRNGWWAAYDLSDESISRTKLHFRKAAKRLDTTSNN